MAEHDLPEDEVNRLLSLTADRVGHSTPPDPAGLVRRAARRDRARRTGAVAAVLLAVLAVVVPVGLIAAHRDATPPRPADDAAPAPLDERGTASALAAGRWRNLPAAPIQGRTAPVTAWTGSQLLVWGGHGASTPTVFLPRLQDGASYNPATRTWQTLPPAPLGSSDGAVSAWTGTRLIVVAGRESASYDPAARRWQSLAGLPSGFAEPQHAVWTGRELVVQGSADTVGVIPLLRALNPQSNTWRDLPYPPIDAGRKPYFLAMAAQNGKLVAVSSTVDDQGLDLLTAVLSLDLASGAWTSVAVRPGSDAGPRGVSELVAGPDALYVPASFRPCLPVAASCPAPTTVQPAYRFVDGVWTALPTGQEDRPTNGTATLWTGSALVALRNQASAQVLDPASGTWTDLPPSPLPDASTAVWAGDRLFTLSSVKNPAGGVSLAGAALLPKPPAASTADLPFATLPVNGVQPTVCGTDAPLSVLAAKPGAEAAQTPEAAALRQVLNTGVRASYFPPKQDWVQMTSSKDAVTFGHRKGPLGLDQIIALKRADGAWSFDRTAPCGALTYNASPAASIDVWTENGSQLLLRWLGGSATCGEGGNGADSSVQETATEVRVVVAPRPPPPLPPSVPCAGTGRRETSRVTLTSPVGSRKVINAGYVPAEAVSSQPEADALQARQAAAVKDAQTLCDAAATTLGLTSTNSFYEDNFYNPMTVGIVRGALPDLPGEWSKRPADTPAAQCFLRGPAPAGDPRPSREVAVAVSKDLPPYVYNNDYRPTGALERLGDPPG